MKKNTSVLIFMSFILGSLSLPAVLDTRHAKDGEISTPYKCRKYCGAPTYTVAKEKDGSLRLMDAKLGIVASKLKFDTVVFSKHDPNVVSVQMEGKKTWTLLDLNTLEPIAEYESLNSCYSKRIDM